MIDAVGQPQSVVVLGGSSQIGQAVVRALPRGRLRRVVLAGRPSALQDQVTAELARDLPAAQVSSVPFDALTTSAHGALVDELFAAGDVDVVVLAFGVLGEQTALEHDPERAVELAQVNFVGAVSMGLHVARQLVRQGSGTLVVLSSVAGVRVRRANFVYGSTKAALDAFAQGLADALQGSGASVVLVRPGFVRTRMTAGLAEAPLATDADAVARDVVRALGRGSRTVYSPAALRPLMLALRVLPRPVFRRLRS